MPKFKEEKDLWKFKEKRTGSLEEQTLGKTIRQG